MGTMGFINEAAAKVLPPARLFRIYGAVRKPDCHDGLYTVDYKNWVTPMRDGSNLIGFARAFERENFLDVHATIDYESAVRLDIEVGKKSYFHPSWWYPFRSADVPGPYMIHLAHIELKPWPFPNTDVGPVEQVVWEMA